MAGFYGLKNMKKNYTFKEFKEFLADKCFYLEDYKQGKYDRKIYNWFDVGKPKKINFYKKSCKSTK